MRYILFFITVSITIAAHEAPNSLLKTQFHTFQAAITKILLSTKQSYPKIPSIPHISFPSIAYPYLIGSCGIASTCVALWSFVRTKYHNHASPQLTLGAWIAEMEQHSAKTNQLITPELQQNVNIFLAVDVYNYNTLKKAISSDILKNAYASIKNDSLSQLLPLLESDCLEKKDGVVYSLLLEPNTDMVGAQKREFLIKDGICIGTHIYTFRQTSDNAFGIKGIYQTSCYYPKNESDVDSECAQYLIKANALIETKKKYDFFHAEWQQQQSASASQQTPPWDAQLYTKVLAELEQHRCKGDLKKKQYCIRTVRCEARDIVAAFKEYEYWMQTDNQHMMQTVHSLDTIAKAKKQARELFESKTTHTPFTFEQLNAIKKKILEKDHA